MKKTDQAVITKLSDKQDESFLPTGIDQLDSILGGGFPRGRLTEISGDPGVGKTYLATKFIATLSEEHTILFCDAEFSLNKDRVTKLGGNPDNIQYLADSRLEDVCEQITNNIGKYDVIILDSIASLVPLTIDSQTIGESSNIGLFARLIKQWCMKMRPRLGRSKTALIVINQMRKPIGMYAKQELPGGMAFAHVCDIRLRLSSNSADRKPGHHIVHAECTKSKVSQPFVKTSFRLDY